MFIVEAFFFKAARALCGTRADKVGAETAPKHAPWKAGFSGNWIDRECRDERGSAEQRKVWLIILNH